MLTHPVDRTKPRLAAGVAVLAVAALLLAAASESSIAKPPDVVRGVYLMPLAFSEHKINETIYYSKQAGLNAAVLHVKDPHGYLYWKSKDPTALAIGAVKGKGGVEAAVERLKANGIWTIAKVDVFQDTALAGARPELAVLDVITSQPWTDKSKFLWANPYDTRVWDYDIALSKELVKLGFDEIQFDYVRFPSDGVLHRIVYPNAPADKTKIETIGAYLRKARSELKPLGATISADVFGMVAWKKDDFGVGQRVEEVAASVDAICPMLYPSHFPSGFLGKSHPEEFPNEIMDLSLKHMQERTKIDVRPWIQGFRYKPEEVNAQLDAADARGVRSWLIWNPASNYAVTYKALEKRLGKTFSEPKHYADLDELSVREPRVVRGGDRVVHYTDYRQGYSILSLETPQAGRSNAYSTAGSVIGTLDEAVMDRILERRGVRTPDRVNIPVKIARLVELLCKDLDVKPQSIRPRPIYIDWKNGCRFTANPPRERLKAYAALSGAPPKEAIGKTAGEQVSMPLSVAQ